MTHHAWGASWAKQIKRCQQMSKGVKRVHTVCMALLAKRGVAAKNIEGSQKVSSSYDDIRRLNHLNPTMIRRNLSKSGFDTFCYLFWYLFLRRPFRQRRLRSRFRYFLPFVLIQYLLLRGPLRQRRLQIRFRYFSSFVLIQYLLLRRPLSPMQFQIRLWWLLPYCLMPLTPTPP